MGKKFYHRNQLNIRKFMQKLNKKQLSLLIVSLILIVTLPLIIFVMKGGLDIRPRALTGNANLTLSADTTDTTVGGEVNVLASMQLTEASLRVSGVDFMLLYDKNSLEVVSITPAVTSSDPNAAFTDAVHTSFGGSFDGTFNFLRVVMTATKPSADLSGGTVTLATIKFRATGNGTATIKYVDDNTKMEVVGLNL